MYSRSITVALLLLAFPFAARAEMNLPVKGVVTSGVGWRVDPFGSGKLLFHRGIDIAVPAGTPVRATRGGRVTFAGLHGGHGSTVIVKHDDGASTLYGHNSSLAVAAGARVEAGEVVAYSGSSGRSTGPHVHYEVLLGRDGGAESAAVEEAVDERKVARGDLRHQQELQMEETMNSILSRIRDTLPQGNGAKGG